MLLCFHTLIYAHSHTLLLYIYIGICTYIFSEKEKRKRNAFSGKWFRPYFSFSFLHFEKVLKEYKEEISLFLLYARVI